MTEKSSSSYSEMQLLQKADAGFPQSRSTQVKMSSEIDSRPLQS
jgi:hypothetical protein